jgi:hypothetical protein
VWGWIDRVGVVLYNNNSSNLNLLFDNQKRRVTMERKERPEKVKNMEWVKCGSLYYAVAGYDQATGNKVYIYNVKPELPARGELMRYGDAIIIVANNKQELNFITVPGRRIKRVEGSDCLWFGCSFTLDLSEYNALFVILIGGGALLEVEDGDNIYTVEVGEEIIKYPNVTIDGYLLLKQQQ